MDERMDSTRADIPHPSSLSPRWQRAAMLGSLWAAAEIVLGSFLHNVGVPFAGTVLAGIGVAILVAGLQLWNDPGILWRAGVICSLMKSISPSSVILGPMVGILAETGLVYVFALAFRSSLVGCVLGGMLATVTPILQKVISIIVTYGMDAARMYTSLFTLLSDRIQFREVGPEGALAILIAAQAIPGGVAALAGASIARRTRAAASPPRVATSSPAMAGDLFAVPLQPTSQTALALHIVLLVAGLGFLSLLPPLITPLPVAVYFAGVLFWYPGLRPKFKRVRLWLEFGAVAILAGVFLGIFAPEGRGTWWTGLQSGIVMTARATLVVTAFSAISIELRNPVVVNWFLRRGLGNVSAALGVAFQALPAMTLSLNQQRDGLYHPLRALSQMLSSMLAQCEETFGAGRKACVYLLTGKQGAGKTTLLQKAVAQLRGAGVSVGGILAHVRHHDSVRIGYDVEDIRTGECAALCRTDHGTAGETVGPFVFREEGLALGKKALAGTSRDGVSIAVVDEVGPLEMKGEGWAVEGRHLLDAFTGPIVFVVRPDLVDELQRSWGFLAQRVWNTGETTEADVIQTLTSQISRPFSGMDASYTGSNPL